MTPRTLRSAIQNGEMTVVDPKMYKGLAPAPPPEWPEWRRDRLKVAVHAAILFLRGKVWSEIGSELRKEGMLEDGRREVSKARVNQYVDKGVKFMLDRGCFRTVKNKGAE